MTENKYITTADGDRKFTADGEVREYLGNTIVCMKTDPNDYIVQLGCLVQEELQKLSAGEKYYFLPPSSFHMTVISLLNDWSRGINLWPNYLDGASMAESDRVMAQKVAEIPKPQNIEMRISEITAKRFELSPASEEVRQSLKDYRDQIARVTGIKRGNHDSYQFHLSMCYLTQNLSEKEIEEVEGLLQRLNDKYVSQEKTISFPEPSFVIFNDMTAYSEDLNQRIE